MRKRSFLAPLAALAMAALAVIPAPAQAASSSYPLYNSFMQDGPSTPFANSSFVPQGLAKIGENYLIISYHDAADDNPQYSKLAVVNRITGAHTATYQLNTHGHVGGLATTPSTPYTPALLWVSQPDSSDPTKDKLWKYALPSTSSSTSNPVTLTAQAGYTVSASSYAFAQGNTIWVGEFKKGWKASDGCPAYNDSERQKMYAYDVYYGAPTTTPARTIITPARVQGVTVTGSRIVWSTSCGRTNDSQLIYGPVSSYSSNSTAFKAVLAPVLSEGMVIADNKQQIVFESASSEYYNASNHEYTINSQFASLP